MRPGGGLSDADIGAELKHRPGQSPSKSGAAFVCMHKKTAGPKHLPVENLSY